MNPAAATSPGGLRSTIVVHRCGRTPPPFVTSHPPSPYLAPPHVGDNPVDTGFAHRHTLCGYQGENPWMTARQMGVTTGFTYPICGRRETVHNRGELCTVRIHRSYTQTWAGHLRQRGLSTESTGPTTTMRPITLDPAPSTWGKCGSRSAPGRGTGANYQPGVGRGSRWH